MSLLFTAIASIFRIHGTHRLCRLFEFTSLKKGNDYISDHLKRGWMLTD